MNCPFCLKKSLQVLESRAVNQSKIRRRRQCTKCSGRFTTYETMESTPTRIIKKDGTIQSFDRNKILNGIIKSCEKTLYKVGNAINDCHFREALRLIFELAQTGNQYLDKKEPWKQIKIDLENASTTLWTGFQIISTLNTLITPFLPFSAEKLTEILGINKHTSWIIQTIPGGTKFLKPFPLFKKFDAELIATELDRLKKN